MTPNVLTLDEFGGVLSATVASSTGFFRVQKIGERWTFVDPLGHPYRMLGVFDVDFSASPSAAAVLAKYGGNEAAWGLQAVRRLRSWGFNATAEYSSAYVVPVNRDGSYETAEPMPWVAIMRPAYYSLRNTGNYAPTPVKDLVAGLGNVYRNYRGDTLPDVFDPSFALYTAASLAAETNEAMASSPWLIGTAVDDLDDLWGFGPGPDMPAMRQVSHIGWLALCTNFQQAANASLGVTYSDGKVYTKLALANWLQAKYGSIAALDAAWGANYTTFGTAGGYGTGTGLLDEDGRNHWVSADDVALTTASAAVRSDLDAFLTVFAQKYFSIVGEALRRYRPRQLVFGPCTLNGWNGISRAAILAAAGQYCDVIQANVANQAVYDATLVAAGDHPIVTWVGMPANPDSCRSGRQNPDNAQGGFTTQAARGVAYGGQVAADFGRVGSQAAASLAGSRNVVGIKHWAWSDSHGEQANWGLVTFLDNPYDGASAVVAAGKDAWGYATGGEAANYGDFIGEVARANWAALARGML